jgi:glycosyl transferase family 2
MNVLIAVMLVLGLLPPLLYWINGWFYRRAPAAIADAPPVSVLIPARNEERSIRAAIDSVLATQQVPMELVVLDDHSADQTGSIVRQVAGQNPRVRLIESAPLPDGWCGKQFACHQLAQAAKYDLLLFLDADVRIERDAIARLNAFLDQSGAGLVSGVPRQETNSLPEKLIIPLIHFLLLGFLPFFAMRRFRHPAWAAGCGQLFLARRGAYDSAGGHAAIRDSLHDGITLPRAFRRAGRRTDLCDATDLAVCRMYRSGRELWAGLSKNAHEGLGSPLGILPWTVILLGGQVLPWALLVSSPVAAGVVLLANYSVRLDAARRFRQSWLGALLHPVGVVLLVAIQWSALLRRLIGRPIGWKGRSAPQVNAAIR